MDRTAAPYAGLITRGVAMTVDVVIVNAVALITSTVLGLLVSAIVPGHQSVDLPTVLATGAVWLVLEGGYFIGFWTLLGRTPGMRLMGIEVVTADGGRIGFGRASLRVLGLVLAAIPLGAGFLLSLVDDRRQGLQDKVARTVVLYAAPAGQAAAVTPGAAARPAALPVDGPPVSPAEGGDDGAVLAGGA